MDIDAKIQQAREVAILTRRRTVERDRLVGMGRLLSREKELISAVRYDLRLHQEMLRADTISGATEIDGLRGGRGTIDLIDRPKDVWNLAEAILELDGGAQVDVLFRYGLSPLKNVHEFITSGEIRTPVA